MSGTQDARWVHTRKEFPVVICYGDIRRMSVYNGEYINEGGVLWPRALLRYFIFAQAFDQWISSPGTCGEVIQWAI